MDSEADGRRTPNTSPHDAEEAFAIREDSIMEEDPISVEIDSEGNVLINGIPVEHSEQDIDLDDAHGHYGGFGTVMVVAEAVALGVAGNAAYHGIVIAVNRYRRRVAKRRRSASITRAEAIELAAAAVHAHNETVDFSSFDFSFSQIVLKHANEQEKGMWAVKFELRYRSRRRRLRRLLLRLNKRQRSTMATSAIWVDIKASDPDDILISIESCEYCRDKKTRCIN